MTPAAGAARAPTLPERVDYLVVGAGATGMAFCDTLLHHAPAGAPVSVALVDDRSRPGGQWTDSYDFVRLHQPSDMYGVESARLEPPPSSTAAAGGGAHRATRAEILEYYAGVCRGLEERFDFRFVGDASFDLSQLDDLDGEMAGEEGAAADHREYMLSGGRSVWARKVVDGRYLEPDLPVHVPPKLRFDPSAIECVPVNSLADKETRKKYYVIIGAGKTGVRLFHARDQALLIITNSLLSYTKSLHLILSYRRWMRLRSF